jgi:hypothetical protein
MRKQYLLRILLEIVAQNHSEMSITIDAVDG